MYVQLFLQKQEANYSSFLYVKTGSFFLFFSFLELFRTSRTFEKTLQMREYTYEITST